MNNRIEIGGRQAGRTYAQILAMRDALNAGKEVYVAGINKDQADKMLIQLLPVVAKCDPVYSTTPLMPVYALNYKESEAYIAGWSGGEKKLTGYTFSKP